MKGKTNCKAVKSLPCELVNIRLVSNQSEHDDLIGATFSVSYESFSEEYTWDGSEMTLQIPAHVEYSVSFGDVEGYKTPDSETRVAVEDNAYTVEAEYKCELLTVNVGADNGNVSGFKVAVSEGKSILPNGYAELSYIESNGSQYIDTGYSPTSTDKTVLDCEITYSSSWTMIMGSYTSGSYYSWWTKGSTIYAYYGSSNKNATGPVGRAILTTQGTSWIAGGTTITVSSSLSGTPGTLYLGSVNKGGSYALATMKIYSFKIYSANNELIMDYIPAINADGVAGLYEKVNGVFHTSSGSSNFVAGAVIEGEVIATQTTPTGSYRIPYDTEYTVKASDVDGFETPASISRTASEPNYVADMEYKEITLKDLSMYDIYGNPINRSTANCYVIREAGQYKFPLVYGNAIKNGKVNTAAFTNNGATYSHDFVDGFGYTIEQPYIGNDVELLGYSVEIVNNDIDAPVSDLAIFEGDDCKYIQFQVDNIPSEGANFLVAVYSDIRIIWSWHIWLWSHDLSPVEITNSTGVKYNIMPVNLASKYDSDGIHIKNWFYQWGRPNPMLLPASYNSSSNHSSGTIGMNSKASSLFLGITNPSTFYYNSYSPYNWFGDKSYYNLWDAACTGTGNSDNDTVKTVYDPCPVGWKVPNGNTFTGLAIISSANGIVKMRRYSGDTTGVGFPLSGTRYHSDGSLFDGNSAGRVWLSSAYGQGAAYYMDFGSANVIPQEYYYRASGYSVRPVEDDNIQLDVIMISFTIDETPYQAESGMTWFEWVNSEYNTAGFFVDLSFIALPDSGVTPLYVGDNDNYVSLSANIRGGEAYILSY